MRITGFLAAVFVGLLAMTSTAKPGGHINVIKPKAGATVKCTFEVEIESDNAIDAIFIFSEGSVALTGNQTEIYNHYDLVRRIYTAKYLISICGQNGEKVPAGTTIEISVGDVNGNIVLIPVTLSEECPPCDEHAAVPMSIHHTAEPPLAR